MPILIILVLLYSVARRPRPLPRDRFDYSTNPPDISGLFGPGLGVMRKDK